MIYAWTGANYANVSDRFKDFYRERLGWLERTIPALQSVNAKGYALGDKECLQAEGAAIQRFLGISSDAGIEQAVRLATSKDRAEREFATELLGEIATSRAREYLEKLAKDSDYAVAADAKYSLSRSSRGPMKIVSDVFVLN